MIVAPHYEWEAMTCDGEAIEISACSYRGRTEVRLRPVEFEDEGKIISSGRESFSLLTSKAELQALGEGILRVAAAIPTDEVADALILKFTAAQKHRSTDLPLPPQPRIRPPKPRKPPRF